MSTVEVLLIFVSSMISLKGILILDSFYHLLLSYIRTIVN